MRWISEPVAASLEVARATHKRVLDGGRSGSFRVSRGRYSTEGLCHHVELRWQNRVRVSAPGRHVVYSPKCRPRACGADQPASEQRRTSTGAGRSAVIASTSLAESTRRDIAQLGVRSRRASHVASRLLWTGHRLWRTVCRPSTGCSLLDTHTQAPLKRRTLSTRDSRSPASLYPESLRLSIMYVAQSQHRPRSSAPRQRPRRHARGVLEIH